MRTLLILLLCLIFCGVSAQNRPPGMRDMHLVNNISDLLEEAMPWLEDYVAIENATDKIKNNKDLITEILNWNSNGGYLIRIKVLRNNLSGATVPMPPEFIGAGTQPSDILATSSSLPSISTTPNPNLTLASDRSFYIWVTQKKGGPFDIGKMKLQYGYIVSPFAEKVTNDALKKMANLDVLESIKVAQQGQILTGILQNLKRNVKDKEAEGRAAERVDSYRKNLERLNELEISLKRDLTRIDQANNTLKFLNTMRNILSVASLAIQVSTALEDIPAAQVNRARTPDDLVSAVESYRTQSSNRVQEVRKSIIIIRNNISGEEVIITDELRRLGVPSSVINSGFKGLP